MIEKGLLARLGEADSAHPPALVETAALRGDAHGSVAGGGGAARGTLVGGGELQRPGPAQAEDGVAAAAYRLFSGKRSEEHTSELQSLMRSSYAVFCLKKKKELTH